MYGFGWLYWLVAGLLAWLGFVGLLWLFQRGLLYFPDRTVPDPAEWSVPEFRPVRIAAGDDLALFAWWRPPPVPEAPVILYLHGNAGHLGCRANKYRVFLDAGFGVLALTWRYNAGAGGRPSENNLYADGRAAVEFLRREGIDPKRIVPYGESLGAGVAITLAAEGQTTGPLVLESPYSSIVDVARSHYWYVPAGLLLRDRFEMMEKIRAVRVPVLVVHGALDTIIPPRLPRRLFAAASEPKTIQTLPEAGHIDLYEHGAGAFVVDFVRKWMSRSAGVGGPRSGGASETYGESESWALAVGS